MLAKKKFFLSFTNSKTVEIFKASLKPLLVTFFLISIIRIGTFISLPNFDRNILQEIAQSNSPLKNLLFNRSGKEILGINIFTLGIIPYINASIVIQLFITINSDLKKSLKEDGQNGQKKIFLYTRYLTFFWALIQSFVIAYLLRPFSFNSNNLFDISCILTTGAMINLWVSESITKYGIANGSSLLIFLNILTSRPSQLPPISFIENLIIVITVLLTISGIILLLDSNRVVFVIPAKELGNKNNEIEKKDTIPLKINQAGIMPLIFTSYFLPFLCYIFNILDAKAFELNTLIPNSFGQIIYSVVEFQLICAFNYYYSTIIFDAKDISENLSKGSYFINGIKPGEQTYRYFNNLSKRLAILGGTGLAAINFFLNFISITFQLPIIRSIGISSQIIIVGVVIEVIQKVQTIMISKKYNDFEK